MRKSQSSSEEGYSLQKIHKLSTKQQKSKELESNPGFEESPLTKEALKLYQPEDKEKIETILEKFAENNLEKNQQKKSNKKTYIFLAIVALIILVVFILLR